jgi:hypothetical protein
MASTSGASLIPRFNGEHYDYWSSNMKVPLKSKELWKIVEDGFNEPEDEETLNAAQKKTLCDNRKQDSKALFEIYQAIDMSVFGRIYKAKNAKEAWNLIHAAYKGEETVKKVRLQSLRLDFEKMEMKENEGIRNYFTRVNSVVNQMASNDETLENERIVQKVLRSLPQKFDYVVVAIEESKDVSTLSVEDLQGRLEAHEIKINRRNPPPSQPDKALTSQVTNTGGQGSYRGHVKGRGRFI